MVAAFFAAWISIHKALAGLDDSVDAPVFDDSDFNPQGPRGPRHSQIYHILLQFKISIHKALAGLDLRYAKHKDIVVMISIHKALAGLDFIHNQGNRGQLYISIHKALAGLDLDGCL